jgi:sulfide:quinone oxidoreductase
MRVIVAGGGVAALETVLALRTIGGPRLSIELLAPNPKFVDRPSSVATAFGFGAPEPLALEAIARHERVELRRGALAAVEPDSASRSPGTVGGSTTTRWSSRPAPRLVPRFRAP